MMTIQILILHVLTSFCDSVSYFEQSTFCVEFLSFQILQNGNFPTKINLDRHRWYHNDYFKQSKCIFWIVHWNFLLLFEIFQSCYLMMSLELFMFGNLIGLGRLWSLACTQTFETITHVDSLGSWYIQSGFQAINSSQFPQPKVLWHHILPRTVAVIF